MCACGNPDGENAECERCRFVAEIASLRIGIGECKKMIDSQRRELADKTKELKELRDSLMDYDQCAVCKKWFRVEAMLIPTWHPKDSETLCCSDACCWDYGCKE